MMVLMESSIRLPPVMVHGFAFERSFIGLMEREYLTEYGKMKPLELRE
jgi:hypothetical protein